MTLPCEREQESRQKVVNILAACKSTQSVEDLRAFCTSSGGLVNDKVRRIAWPILLNCQPVQQSNAPSDEIRKQLPRHRDEEQVLLDVNRAFVYYPKDESEEQLNGRKIQLSELITRVLREHPSLCYFQGYHDIAQVFLLVLGPDVAVSALTSLSLLRIRDFMLPSLAPSIAQLNLLPAILQAEAPSLSHHLATIQPFFALSATLTLYAHEIQEYGDIARLFDFLIAYPAVESVYLFATIVLSRSEELFEIPSSEPEMLHSILSKLPRPLDLELLISRTIRLVTEHPPESLPTWAWWHISSYSVLRTTRVGHQNQTVQDGENLFAAHLKQLQRQKCRERTLRRISKYRPARAQIALAIGVAVLALWLNFNDRDGYKILDLQSLQKKSAAWLLARRAL